MSWFTESNRWKHFVCAIPEGLLFTVIFAVGCATGMEIKDCHYDKNNANLPIYKWNFRNWDWLDWTSTLLGGLVGQVLAIILYLLFF